MEGGASLKTRASGERMGIQSAPSPQLEEVSETVLRHPERIGAAIACAALMVFMAKKLIALVHGQDISEVVPILVFWIVGVIATCFGLVWSLAVFTVVRKESEDLTIGWTLGGVGYRRVTSVFLKDLTNMVARERFYAVKGRRTRGYQILFGPEKERSELLGRLTRQQVDALARGALRGMLTIEG
jgi:hypothetical protein